MLQQLLVKFKDYTEIKKNSKTLFLCPAFASSIYHDPITSCNFYAPVSKDRGLLFYLSVCQHKLNMNT